MPESCRLDLRFFFPDSKMIQRASVIEREHRLPSAEANQAATPMAIRMWTWKHDRDLLRRVIERCGSRALPPVRYRLDGLDEPVEGSSLYYSHLVGSVLELGRPRGEDDDAGSQRVESRQPFSWRGLGELPELQTLLLMALGWNEAKVRIPAEFPYEDERSILETLAPRSHPWQELLEKSLTPGLPLVTDTATSIDQDKAFLAEAVRLHNAQVDKTPGGTLDTPEFDEKRYRRRMQSGLRAFATKQGWSKETLRSVVAWAARYDYMIYALMNKWLWNAIEDTVRPQPTAAERELYMWAHVRLIRLRTGAIHGPVYWDPILMSLFNSMSTTLQERVLYVAAHQDNYPPEWDEEVQIAIKSYLYIYREYLIAIRQHHRNERTPSRRDIAEQQQRSQERFAPDLATEDEESLKELWVRVLDELETEADELEGRPDRQPIYSHASIRRYRQRDGSDLEDHESLAKRIVNKILFSQKACARDLQLAIDGKDTQQIAESTARTPRAVNANIRRALVIILERLDDMPAIRAIVHDLLPDRLRQTYRSLLEHVGTSAGSRSPVPSG